MSSSSFLLRSVVILGAVFICFSGARVTPPRRQAASTTVVSPAQIASLKPFSFYANAGYCQPSQILNWTCGVSCKANPTFQPIAAGGDGVDVQFWYVGIDPTLQTVIVSHQGTDPSKVLPLITDFDFFLENLNTAQFPGAPTSIQVHNGFASEQAKTATSVFASVQTALQTSGLKQVTFVGHSLGAAISLLDSVQFQLAHPSVNFSFVGFGMPRVGNQAFASFVDRSLNITRINNKEDVIPILPPMSFGFHHPQGENHIQDDNSWVACSGDDNPDSKCSTGNVQNIFEGNLSDHDGPYDGVTMGCNN